MEEFLQPEVTDGKTGSAHQKTDEYYCERCLPGCAGSRGAPILQIENKAECL